MARKKQSGIYSIKGKSKVYIGQSVNVNNRFYQHLSLLRRGNHFNSHLQNFYNKYGEGELNFQVIEYCHCSDLNRKEVFYIDNFDSIKTGFNQTKDPFLGGNNTKGGKLKNWKNGRVYEFDNTAKFCDEQSLSYGLVLQILNQKRKFYRYWTLPEFNFRDVNKISYFKKYLLCDPNGEKVEFDNITDFCEKNSLSYSCVIRVLKGKGKWHKGWRLPSLGPKTILASPKGEIYDVYNLGAFAKLHGLRKSGISALIHNRLKTHKKWRLEKCQV